MIAEVALHEAVERLGPLPASLHRLLAITASPEFDLDEIVDVLDHDMLLTAAVLRRANSASSAPADRIHTVGEAVMRIGAVQTLATAMHSVVGGTFNKHLHRYRLTSRELWRHSCAASIAAAQIRARAAGPLPTSTATTALLHDIGKVVLDVVGVDVPIPTIQAVGDQACAIEEELFGLDHAAMGGMVAEMWHLPPAIVEGIAGHHALVDDPLPSAICLADDVAHLACADTNAEDMVATLAAAESARLILGIDADTVATIVSATQVELDDLMNRFAQVSR